MAIDPLYIGLIVLGIFAIMIISLGIGSGSSSDTNDINNRTKFGKHVTFGEIDEHSAESYDSDGDDVYYDAKSSMGGRGKKGKKGKAGKMGKAGKLFSRVASIILSVIQSPWFITPLLLYSIQLLLYYAFDIDIPSRITNLLTPISINDATVKEDGEEGEEGEEGYPVPHTPHSIHSTHSTQTQGTTGLNDMMAYQSDGL
jgi:hypothetical protein